ncbi:hypothetical protein pdam_00001684 [Pocillopora damicornis]|uniref:Uncharacterized protein n=1 Tax=Pocillopora damicornis TaxID=46731 RepID=A0A3M6UPH9_POCDA|nr:hypothetical protein pdam_00001684 [Pocillopora damicornis]
MELDSQKVEERVMDKPQESNHNEICCIYQELRPHVQYSSIDSKLFDTVFRWQILCCDVQYQQSRDNREYSITKTFYPLCVDVVTEHKIKICSSHANKLAFSKDEAN